MEARRRGAWAVALQAARLLKAEYSASQVLVFGSLAHGRWFGPRSDIDMAVAGIAPEVFWPAWRALDQIDRALEIDLIALEAAPDALRRQIMMEGIEL